jgi:hypothetical protein
MKQKLSTCQFIVNVNRVSVYLLNVSRVRNFVCAIRVGLVSEMNEGEFEMYVAGTGVMRTAGLKGTRHIGRIILKRIFKEQVVAMWTGFVRTRSIGGGL